MQGTDSIIITIFKVLVTPGPMSESFTKESRELTLSLMLILTLTLILTLGWFLHQADYLWVCKAKYGKVVNYLMPWFFDNKSSPLHPNISVAF